MPEDLPEGFRRVEDGPTGISIAIPAAWEEFDLRSVDLERQLEVLKQSSPRLAPRFERAMQSVGSPDILYRLFAVDKAEEAMVFLVVHRGAGSSIEGAARYAVREFEKVGVKASYQETSIDGVPAARLTAFLDVSGEVEEVTQYSLITGGRLISLTVSGTSPAMASVVASLRV